MVGFGVTKFEKPAIPTVWAFDGKSVTDGTPVLFGAGGYFSGKGKGTVEVRTEIAVYFFNSIEVGELVPIETDVVFTGDFADSIDGKANHLKKTTK